MDKKEEYKIRKLIEQFTSDNYDPQLLRTFQDWIGNPANEDTKDEALSRVWDRAKSTGSRAHADKVFRKVCKQAGIVTKNARPSLALRILQAAAVIILPVLAFSALWQYNRGERNSSGETETVAVIGQETPVMDKGEKYMLLADGSEVWVEESSVVVVEGQRETTLEGDALYNIKREYLSGRRFTVNTQFVSATVLGTVFRVTAIPGSGETVVSLYEGQLEVALPGTRLEIGTGTRLTYLHEQDEYRIEDISGIWPHQIGERIIHYSGEVISSVFDEIGRIYGVDVDFRNYSWGSETVTIKFSAVTNLENVMYMLSGISGNFTYRLTDDRLYIYDK